MKKKQTHTTADLVRYSNPHCTCGVQLEDVDLKIGILNRNRTRPEPVSCLKAYKVDVLMEKLVRGLQQIK